MDFSERRGLGLSVARSLKDLRQKSLTELIQTVQRPLHDVRILVSSERCLLTSTRIAARNGRRTGLTLCRGRVAVLATVVVATPRYGSGSVALRRTVHQRQSLPGDRARKQAGPGRPMRPTHPYWPGSDLCGSLYGSTIAACVCSIAPQKAARASENRSGDFILLRSSGGREDESGGGGRASNRNQAGRASQKRVCR
mgnify:CR=1 FL=1